MPRYSITDRRALCTSPAVYKFSTNEPIYVGSTHNLQRRIDIHLYELRANIHRCALLQTAWNSGEHIDVVILEQPENDISRSELRLLEQAHIIADRATLGNIREATSKPTHGWEQRIEALFPDI